MRSNTLFNEIHHVMDYSLKVYGDQYFKTFFWLNGNGYSYYEVAGTTHLKLSLQQEYSMNIRIFNLSNYNHSERNLES